MALLLALGIAASLVVVRTLEPDRSGHGTHQQLGLPPCTFVVLFGRRCPTCGGTTAWANLVRGRVADAFSANAGGALLGLIAIAAVPWLLLSSWRGRWLVGKPGSTAVAWTVMAVFAVMLIDWGVRCLAG